MDGQLSLEDCFITRNGLRAKYGLVELYEVHNTIIPPDEIEHEKEMCAYWVYYNATCRAGVPPKSFVEWKKEIERKRGC